MSNQVSNQPLSQILIANGFAWKFEFAAAALAAGATVNLGFTTGPQGAIVSDRSFSTDGSAAFFGLYRNTTYTGGTPLTLFNRSDRFWNDTSRSPVTAMASGVTATPSAANLMGSINLRSLGAPTVSITTEGQDIFLLPNSSYVIAVTNNDAGAKTPAMSIILYQDRISSGILKWP